MNGSTLKYLSTVADLARLDIEAAAITIEASEEFGIFVFYAGNYARGYRHADYNGEPINVSVNAARFKALAALFTDDDDLDLMPTNDSDGNGLLLRSRRSRSVLREWGQTTKLPTLDREETTFSARLPAQELISEIEIAAEFVAESQVRPSLAGIRLSFVKNYIHIMAFDGGGALYLSRVKARVQGRGTVVVPTQDFVQGARLIGDGDAVIVKPADSGAIGIYNDRALFRASVIEDNWPDTEKVTSVRHATTFQVESAALRNLVAGARALGSPPDISVNANKGYVIFSTEGEGGSFSAAVKGEIETESLFYDTATLGKVTRLGSVLTFSVPSKPNEPTLVEAEHRRCWVVTRI